MTTLRYGVLAVLLPAMLAAAQVSGVVKDPSGLPVEGAKVTLERLTASTDAQGRFHFDPVAAGSHTLTVSHDGFQDYRRSVTVADELVELTVKLELARVVTSVHVTASLRNSDPNYAALRSGEPRGVFRVHDLVLRRDAGTLTFHSGAFSFLPPVLDHVTGAIFIGEGNFKLRPAVMMAAQQLKKLSGAETVDEDFGSAIFYFTDSTYDEIMKVAEPADESPQPYRDALRRLQESTRPRDFTPSSLLELALHTEDAPNLEAEILAELYNPAQRGSFRAFIHGRKHPEFRYIVNPSGAVPALSSPEEVALLNYQPNSFRDGVWYLAHTLPEFQAGRASSSEDKRLIAPIHYGLEVSMNTEGRLTVACDLQFRSLAAGTRVVKFDLLPDFQASSLALDGREVPFIQENRNRDGSFYSTFPEPLEKGRLYRARFEYQGDFVGVYRGFQIHPRQAWYPRPSGNSRATYDLTFRVKGYTVAATGELAGHERDGGREVYHWSSPAPIPTAAFSVDDFQVKTREEPDTHTELSTYLVNRPHPDPQASSALAFEVLGNALRCFHAWFGPLPYGHLAVVENGATDSLPSLLFAPTTYMVDDSARYAAQIAAMGPGGSLDSPFAIASANINLNASLNEGLPRLSAREWWGNAVTPATFHDEWLTGGLADFAATLYDLAADDRRHFLLHWQRARDTLLGPGELGLRRNDSGPVWLGLLLDPFITPRGIAPPTPLNSQHRVRMAPPPRPFSSQAPSLAATKGAFIIHMLRCLMFDKVTRDQDFVALLHDFTAKFADRTVSTEQFKQLAEAHMKPSLDLDHNGRLDWFFNDWVYGCELPSYRLEYAIGQDGATWVASGKLAQTGVSENFRMRVPIYAEFGKKADVVGSAVIAGNHTGDFRVELPQKPDRLALNANYDVLTDKQEVVRNSRQ